MSVADPGFPTGSGANLLFWQEKWVRNAGPKFVYADPTLDHVINLPNVLI